MEDYDALVQATRERVERELKPLGAEHGGDEVQLSVRLPAGLRASVAQLAARRGQSVSAFVKALFERELEQEADPFAGLAADLAASSRAKLAEAVESGAYARAAAEVDEREQSATA